MCLTTEALGISDHDSPRGHDTGDAEPWIVSRKANPKLDHPTLLTQEATVNLNDPFEVRRAADSPSESPPPPPCKWLLPLPEDAEPRTKQQPCGEPAPFQIRVKDFASDAMVDVCPRHKGMHDEIATSLRQKGRPVHRTQPRRKAS